MRKFEKKPDERQETKRMREEETIFPETGRLLPLNGEPFRVTKEMFIPYQRAKLFEELPIEEFEIDGYQVKILQKRMEVFRGKNVSLLLDVDVQKNGEKIKISNDNRIVLFNPPILVGNGTFRKEKYDGKDVEVENTEENIEQAIKDHVLFCIKLYDK